MGMFRNQIWGRGPNHSGRGGGGIWCAQKCLECTKGFLKKLSFSRIFYPDMIRVNLSFNGGLKLCFLIRRGVDPIQPLCTYGNNIKENLWIFFACKI